ncbi:MAG: DUF4345 domain-containing protein [Microscillaceae bacterium]|jgi:hypothetical protein|nr:DUF4345 domain-containing protein [Microscillaceae bacterium]
MKYLNLITSTFLILIGLAFLNVAFQALFSPQTVMDNVGILLNNASASNSVRANYGGMNLMYGLFCLYAAFRMPNQALGLIALFTLGFILGRFWSFYLDGPANGFVINWLVTESLAFVISSTLLYFRWKEIPSLAMSN